MSQADYIPIENLVKPDLGRMWISNRPNDLGFPEVGDIVSVKVTADVELYIRVEGINGTIIFGEVEKIGPQPSERFERWECGSKVSFEQRYISCVFRED
ncbi:MAG: hypothetical protein RQ826_15285 [Xanthomonadales bacterium]|nr:hypothetical protein [Xanthomonadales bacterium]